MAKGKAEGWVVKLEAGHVGAAFDMIPNLFRNLERISEGWCVLAVVCI